MKHVFEGFRAANGAIRRDLKAFIRTAWNLRADASVGGADLGRWFKCFWAIASMQQRTLDEQTLPLLLERVPAFAEHARRLWLQADELRQIAEGVAEALAGYAAARDRLTRVVFRGSLSVRATRFAELLAAHLDHREQHVIPLLVATCSVAELRALQQRAMRKTPLSMMGLLWSWLLASVSPAEEARALRALPWPLRLLYRWRWRRAYDRLAAPLWRLSAASSLS